MTEVQWDMEAFNKIVIHDSTRELIMALVTNKIATTRSADIIEGKGNGLIVLLHGFVQVVPSIGTSLTQLKWSWNW
jgi:hypothetical protein